MHWFRLLLFSIVLLALVSCASSDSPTPEQTGEAAPAAQPEGSDTAVTQPPAEPAPTPEVTEMIPCKLFNVDDSACTSQLGAMLTEILKSQGEGDTPATEAGQAIASAIQNAPLDKRNGFKMKGLDTGKTFAFLFQKIDGVTNLLLFDKAENANGFTIIEARPLTNCQCSD